MSTLDTMPGVVWYYTGTAWKLTAPRGLLLQATWNSGMTATSSTADVPGATLSVPMVTGHTYRYTFTGHAVSTVATDTVRLSNTDGSNALVGVAAIADMINAVANLAQYFTMVNYEVAATTGNVTRKLRVGRQAGTGNVQVFSDTFRVGTFTVEEIHVGTAGG